MNTLLKICLIASLACFVGCGGEEPPIDPGPGGPGAPGPGEPGAGEPGGCATGCLMNGLCQSGNTPAACGASGNQCQICGAGQQCVAGSCQQAAPTCDASTCPDGCCDALTGQCVPAASLSANQCGAGGATCQQCGEGEGCEEGSCAPLNVTYKVMVVGSDTTNFDCDGINDAECEQYLKVQLLTSPEKNNETTVFDGDLATWNEEMFQASRDELLNHTLRIEEWDSDWIDNDHWGTCTWTITQADLNAGYVEKTCDKYEKVKIAFEAL